MKVPERSESICAPPTLLALRKGALLRRRIVRIITRFRAQNQRWRPEKSWQLKLPPESPPSGQRWVPARRPLQTALRQPRSPQDRAQGRRKPTEMSAAVADHERLELVLLRRGIGAL